MSCNCTSTAPIHSCASGTKGLERVNYFPRQIMTVEDMVTEAEYFREKLRRHNRYLHGWGIVCGLDVTPAGISTAPATVSISAGYALGPYGDEIYVGEPVLLDLFRCGPDAVTDPCEPDLLHSRPGVGATVFVAIRYAECLARPVRAMPAGCACEEEDCEYSRVRDSFEISCLTALPPDPGPSSLCDFRGQPVPCPPPPVSPWVVLAQVTLPSTGNITQNNIVTSVRRQLFSTSQIQVPVMDCCCDKGTQPGQQLLLQVGDVLFRGPNIQPFDVKTAVANSTFFDPTTRVLSSSELRNANMIEVRFEGAKLNRSSVKLDDSFAVFGRSATPPDTRIPGKFVVTDDSVLWTANESFPFNNSDLTYVLQLAGDPQDVEHGGTVIVANDNRPLDGHFQGRFPTGDGKPGSDFVLSFLVS